MLIEDGKIKPCSKCLRARQNAARLMGSPKVGKLVQLEFGDVVIGADFRITSIQVMPQDENQFQKLIGRRVYIAGKQLVDVTDKKPVPLTDLGAIVKTSPLTA